MTASDLYDVVVVGAGPAGLLLAVCLARFGRRVKIIDNRDAPTATGRADGIQPRSLDILRNIGLKRKIMACDPAKVYEVAFWDPAPNVEGIHRTGHSKSCPPFIDARYPFTTLLHQGLIERVFIDDLAAHDVSVQRPWTITRFQVSSAEIDYPVIVQLKHVQKSETRIVRSKYLFSGEGARSFIREQLGIKVRYKDPISNVWGVMDGIVKTNFPDVKMKCTIHSDHGSIMIIPREHNLVRLYIQIATSTDKDFNPRRQATPEEVQNTAKKILHPYYIEWEHIEWYSVYPIGQGIAERYTLDHRVFLGGDCCHTHSPKAGQGMNAAFHDALNLAWKIHLVEAGFAKREILSTYESERKLIAEELLNFDAKYAALFSQRRPTKHENAAWSSSDAQDDPFVSLFRESSEFTSGYGIVYRDNVFNWHPSHTSRSRLFNPEGSKVSPGRAMPTADVTRVVDANVVKLEHEVPLNGSFRLFIFVGRPTQTRNAVSDLAMNFERNDSFYYRFRREDIANISHHERHNPHSCFFTICIIYAASRADIHIRDALPPLFARYSNHIYADDITAKSASDPSATAHAKMGFQEECGGILVVRPDGHVGCVLSLTEGRGSTEALNEYFGSFTAKGSNSLSSKNHL